MKENGQRQTGGEVWWPNDFHLPFKFSSLGFYWESVKNYMRNAFTLSKRLFTCGKATKVPLYLPVTEAHLHQPARRTSQQSLAVAYFYALQGQSAASASSLANQATNRCSHPALNHLTLHCHSINGFKGYQMHQHLSENQSNRIHYLAQKTRGWKRKWHPWQGEIQALGGDLQKLLTEL